MFLLAIAFWFLCAIVAAIVAWSKGRSGCGFGILAFLFGPLGLIAAAIASPDRGRDDRRAISTGHARACPHCKGAIPWDVSACRHCGGQVIPVHEDPTPFSRLIDKLTG